MEKRARRLALAFSLLALDFDTVGNMASYQNDPLAQLYWATLGRMMSTEGYGSNTPQEIHAEMLGIAQDVFKDASL